MTIEELGKIGYYYVNEAVTKKDVQKNPLMNMYSSRYIRTFSTITKFNLKQEDARELVISKTERYPDEVFEDYKVRLKARDGFAKHYKNIFRELAKSAPKETTNV
jgi:hypothetical protein